MSSEDESPRAEKTSPRRRQDDAYTKRKHSPKFKSLGSDRDSSDHEDRNNSNRRPQSSVIRVSEQDRRRHRSPSSEGEIRSDDDDDALGHSSRGSKDNSRRRRDRSRSKEYRSRSRDRSHRERRRKRSRSDDKENTSRDRFHKRQAPVSKNAEKSSAVTTETASETTAPPARERNSNAKAMKDLLTTKTGGAYIPPAKLRLMQQQITDKSSAAYQRLAWEALKKSITGLVNKVNKGNMGVIVRELFRENIVRGRGLLSRCIIQAQASSPTFTHIYAALVAVINTKFPKVGELLLRRLVIQFRRGFRRNDKALCISSVKFIAHLVNQSVAHEILALEILTLLVENPTDDSVEVAIAFLKECGDKLTEVSSKALHSIFEMLRNILHEGVLDKRVQYMIEVMFQVRKEAFKNNKAVEEGLDVVDEEDQFTHLITLDEATDPQDILNVFKFDAEFQVNEEKYATLRKELLDEDSGDSDSEDGSGEDGSDSDSDSDNSAKREEDEAAKQVIIDNTETNLIQLRRTIYLTITSSLDYEECAHKLLRMSLKPGQESELCHMFLDCCAQQRTYEKFYGLLAQRFCQMNKIYVAPFQKIFEDTYSTVHRLETKMLRNVSKFFGHLLFTDAISWEVLNCVRLTEEDTNSSSRIFIKILFQELSEYMGLQKLNDRVKDPTLQFAFEGLFPRDNPKNTRFAINFFTSIGLGGLTDELREHLKAQPKAPVVPAIVQALPISSSSSSSSSSTSSSSSSSSSSDDSSSDDEPKSKKKRKSKKSKSSKKAPKKSKSKKHKNHSSKNKKKSKK